MRNSIIQWTFPLAAIFLFSGCTYIAYQTGSAVDTANAKEIALPDTSELQEGDYLKLTWTNGKKSVAFVNEIDAGFVGVSYVIRGHRVYVTLRSLSQQENLVSIEKLERSSVGRWLITPIGVVGDMAILGIVALAYMMRDFEPPGN